MFTATAEAPAACGGRPSLAPRSLPARGNDGASSPFGREHLTHQVDRCGESDPLADGDG